MSHHNGHLDREVIRALLRQARYGDPKLEAAMQHASTCDSCNTWLVWHIRRVGPCAVDRRRQKTAASG